MRDEQQRKVALPSDPGSGAALLSAFNINHARKLDKRTLQIPCRSPFSTLPDVLACYDYGVIPAGFDPNSPVGTGPFRHQSFTPGNESVFTRNAGYWQHGLPYVDEVTIVDYQDETSQVDSLLGGQANLAAGLSAVSIAPVKGGGARITVSMGGGWTPFVMRVDVAPFNDVNVRQAFRYICDRDQMISIVGSGQGTLGNDVFSIWDPGYDNDLPQRHQDLDQARFLLKKAGYDQLTVDLVSSPLVGGMTDAAQVFQQQATAVGVTVNVQQVTTTELFGPNFLSWPFTQDYWFYNPYFPQVAKATLPTGPYDETHWDNPRYSKLYAAGLATTDKARQAEIAHEMQLIDYDSGGYMIPYFPPVIDGYAANVRGVVASKVGLPFNDFDFKQVWIAD